MIILTIILTIKSLLVKAAFIWSKIQKKNSNIMKYYYNLK